ncbi:MAG TPA: AAA family ATPase [Candidatus Saccharimonadales bacterium]|nr:AAA family ATPase [Candidatus Saccharimonadales bacterium]
MDSSASLDTQIQKLEEKVKNAQLPADLLEKIDGMLTLLRMTLKSGGGSFINYEGVSSYIDWIVSLPFNKETTDTLNLTSAKQILDKNHYGLESVKNRIMEYLAAIILSLQNNTEDKVIRAPILCLIGLVGTGKTTLAISIAESLGRKFERIPFGGMGDARALRGQSRAFADAEPGAIVKKLVHAQSKNPVILLDELDRVTEDARADIMGVLVEMLDPEQNKSFTDHYIDYPIDLSHVLFVATANNTTNISTAVLDRLEIVQMPSYTDAEKAVIAKSYLFPKIRAASGLKENQVVIDEGVWPGVIRPLGFDSGIRSLERTIEGVCRKIARLIVEGKLPAGNAVHITGENLKQFLPT